MGSSSSKESKQAPPRSAPQRRSNERTAPGQPPPPPLPVDRLAAQIYGARSERGSRPELPFLHLGRDREQGTSTPERPRETKQEREARKLEKERQARVKERERSLREEHVDGGYLVTLGTYTGPEDFSKGIVRQLQIERRLAPFWRGLNDHSESWTEAQLVAAVKGLPIPAADEIPPEMARTTSQASSNTRLSDLNVNSLTVPISSRSLSYESGTSATLSASHPAFSSSGPASPTSPTSSTAQLIRGRAKTLASLATGSKSHSPDLTPQEIKLPRDPNVHGQPIEAYLYKDASECPICFMYYPPYLNKTRCCDQPICSECFVQIKRPDPHPPEHEQPGQPRPPEEEAEMLVSEVASCPFCVMPEFGVSYEPPPFRRGLVYAHQANRNPLRNPTSAMSSTSSLGTAGGRRRTTSLSANAPQVITTDRVRPDWAKKLADARAHALRRSAAATALHNAAYVLGSQGDGQLRGSLAGFGRRRRTLFGDSPSASGSGTPRGLDGGIFLSPYGHIIRAGAAHRAGEEGDSDLYPARSSSRRTRVDDLEDLMMMEAIRLSLAAEEDRKRKEDKEAKKDAKKKAKEEKKEAKHAEKLARKGAPPLYRAETNESSSTWASTSMARSTSNLGFQTSIPEEQIQGKGKAPVQDFAGFNPLSEPTSTLNTEMTEPRNEPTASPFADPSPSAADDPQRYLEESRANLQPSGSSPIAVPARPSPHLRQLSSASSMASSFESSPGSLRADSNLPSATGSGLDVSSAGFQDSAAARSGTPPVATTPNLEPMLNFRSLAAMVGDEEDKDGGRESEHIEHATSPAEEQFKEPSPTGSPRISPATSTVEGSRSRGDSGLSSGLEGNRSRGDSGESSASAPPPIYVESAPSEDSDAITPAPQLIVGNHNDVDRKDIGNIDVYDRGHMHEATQ